MTGKLYLVLGASAIAFVSNIAYAQTTAPAANAAPEQTAPPEPAGTPAAPTGQSYGIEDIVVTAQKRSQNLQNVPIAVSAVTETQLSRAGVKDVVDLKIAVPTLNVTNSAGYLTSSLRGIGSNGFGAGIENPIALYIDGVYYAAPAASLLTLNNISQIEVLKGPQGTLFGRNATGGLIQVTTRDPSSTPAAEFNISYGNYNSVTGNGYVAGPITSNLFMDLAVSGAHQGDGWGTNYFNGKDVQKLDHDIAVRSKLIWEPSDSTKFTLIGDYSDHRDSIANAYRVFRGTVSGYTPNAPAFPDIGYNTDRGHSVEGTLNNAKGEQPRNA